MANGTPRRINKPGAYSSQQHYLFGLVHAQKPYSWTPNGKMEHFNGICFSSRYSKKTLPKKYGSWSDIIVLGWTLPVILINASLPELPLLLIIGSAYALRPKTSITTNKYLYYLSNIDI